MFQFVVVSTHKQFSLSNKTCTLPLTFDLFSLFGPTGINSFNFSLWNVPSQRTTTDFDYFIVLLTKAPSISATTSPPSSINPLRSDVFNDGSNICGAVPPCLHAPSCRDAYSRTEKSLDEILGSHCSHIVVEALRRACFTPHPAPFL